MDSVSAFCSVAGLKAASEDVWQMARELGLEGRFGLELSAMERRAEFAVLSGSQVLVEAVVEEFSGLARQIAVTSHAVRRLGAVESVRVAESPSTLSSLVNVPSESPGW